MKILINILFVFLLIGCQSNQSNKSFLNLMRDSSVKINPEYILKQPLGSKSNPVRVSEPSGEVDYLSRLRCSNNNQLSYRRTGSVGVGPWGYILDLYQATCSIGEKLIEYSIYMDMYHPNYDETHGVFGLILNNKIEQQKEQEVGFELFCEQYNCRKNISINLKTEDGNFNKKFDKFAPIIVDLSLSILPNEKLFIEAEIENGKVVHYTHRNKNINPSTTFILDFKQLDDSNGMMFHLFNPFKNTIKFHMLMMDFGGDFHQTSSCPASAGASISELWPHPVLQLVLTDPSFLKASDKINCVY